MTKLGRWIFETFFTQPNYHRQTESSKRDLERYKNMSSEEICADITKNYGRIDL